MQNSLDLFGVGIGPFNLSLASLLSPIKDFKALFADEQKSFSWHSELMFPDAVMQTSFLKDLVTAVDPTNEFSFLNYLTQKGLFYQFMNTGRTSLSRMEFQDYCLWASHRLDEKLSFDTKIEDISFNGEVFVIKSNSKTYFAKNICLGTGPVKRIPEFAHPFLSKNVFHAKSQDIKTIDFTGKRVLIVGGGQTGLEIFRNSLQGKWGRAQSIAIVSDRQTFRPLDEAAFSNDFFTPNFIGEFFHVDQSVKDAVVEDQKFMSDGNTPSYLNSFYSELYIDKYYQKKFCDYKILPMRRVVGMSEIDNFYNIQIENTMFNKNESLEADIVIFATGFETKLPKCMNSLYSYLKFDEKNRPILEEDYSLRTTLAKGKIFAMNFSRHCHGIADPQTSLMAFRSACIVNSLVDKKYYKIDHSQDLFSTFN